MRRLRNIGIIAHIDAGKTTVSERILFYTGRIRKPGETHDGASTLDDDVIEKQKGITINAAATFCAWRHTQSNEHCHVNLIDTPGHVDFTAEVERSLRVLDGAVCVLDGKEGVEAQTETVWRQAKHYGIPVIAFVNKMDKRGADYRRCLDALAGRLRANPIVVQIPLGQGDEYEGVIDLIAMQAVRFSGAQGIEIVRGDVPASMRDTAEAARRAMLEAVGGLDETIGDLVLEGRWDDIEAVALRNAIRQATLARTAVPVLFGSALRDTGVQPLLDAVVDYLPAPDEVARQRATMAESGKVVDLSSEDGAVAFVFKTVRDEFGTLSYLRVFSGKIALGGEFVNARTGRTVKLGRLYRMHANERTTVDSAEAGDFVAAIAQGDVRTGDTLSEPGRAVALEAIRFPEPVIEAAIEPITNLDSTRLGEALAARALDDPTLRVSTDADTGEMLVAGMGELQLDVLLQRLRDIHGVEARLGAPRVAFRECLSGRGETEGLHRKQSGGSGSFGYVKIRWVSLPSAQYDEIEFLDSTKGGVIPKLFIRHVEQGIRAAAEAGGMAGFPVGGFRAELYDGKSHDQDGKDFAFADAARLAFRALLDEVGTEILEPVMRVEVRVPDEFTGAVMGDLSARRGRVTGIDSDDGEGVIRAVVPLAEMFGYVGDLRGMTQGRGQYSMEPAGYEQAPTQVKQGLMGTRS